jgi:hypothetical protein
LTDVKSSNVKAIGYDPGTKYLYIQFLPESKAQHGPLYRYKGVREEVYRRFTNASSKGIFVWSNVRDKYPYSKWTGFGWRKENALKRMAEQKRRRKKTFRRWNR